MIQPLLSYSTLKCWPLMVCKISNFDEWYVHIPLACLNSKLLTHISEVECIISTSYATPLMQLHSKYKQGRRYDLLFYEMVGRGYVIGRACSNENRTLLLRKPLVCVTSIQFDSLLRKLFDFAWHWRVLSVFRLGRGRTAVWSAAAAETDQGRAYQQLVIEHILKPGEGTALFILFTFGVDIKNDRGFWLTYTQVRL